MRSQTCRGVAARPGHALVGMKGIGLFCMHTLGSSVQGGGGEETQRPRERGRVEKQMAGEKGFVCFLLPELEVCTAAAVETLDILCVELERRVAPPLGRFRVGNL